MTFRVVIAVLIAFAPQLRAQSDFKTGDRVEYRDSPSSQKWWSGTIVKLLPEYKQVVVRWDPRADYPAYTHNGVSTYEQGYNVSEVRHPGAHSGNQPAPAAAGAKTVKSASTQAATEVKPCPFKVGDMVEGWNVDWYNATVTQIGIGQYAGYCYLKPDKGSTGQWISAKNIRPLQASSAQAGGARSPAPPTTKYVCGVYLNNNFTYTQAVVLKTDGTYQPSTGPAGRYHFDPGTKRIDFEGGSFQSLFGLYEPENHEIFRLTMREDRAKSPEAQNWRSQVCSPQK
ncbi:hypothetical protein [Bryobacter aggregatus]|uniref:hypothetical protein n=1 Tax=Bryobacter aggregatus TaxID=360054 RepID=UPI0004E212B4|nr:hypothetical protein [Bryobacter aggregatus]